MSGPAGRPPRWFDYFERGMNEKLEMLQKGQTAFTDRQEKMHETNERKIEEMLKSFNLHASQDMENFGKVNGRIDSLDLVKKLMYSAIGMILIAFLGAVIALVIKK